MNNNGKIRRFILKGLLITPFVQKFAYAKEHHGANQSDTYGETQDHDVLSLLKSYYPQGSDIKAIGDAFLTLRPAERDVTFLIRELTNKLRMQQRGYDGNTDSRAIKHAIDDLITRDFLQQNVVGIRGWVLAEYECRLCALYAMT